MITIDEDKMREEVESFIEAELWSTSFTSDVIEMVWEVLFKETELSDEDDAAATVMYDKIFKECIDKMLKALKH